MRQLALAFALTGAFALAVPAGPAQATIETPEARMTAADAAAMAKQHMVEAFGKETLKNGEFLWKKGGENKVTRLVISLPDQLAYAYRDDDLIGVSTLSSGKESKPTPTGIFPILEKKRHHRSIKYDNAPMPYMQRLDKWGIALHAGNLPGYPASHGCVRFPSGFAAKLFEGTKVGTPVLIGG